MPMICLRHRKHFMFINTEELSGSNSILQNHFLSFCCSLKQSLDISFFKVIKKEFAVMNIIVLRVRNVLGSFRNVVGPGFNLPGARKTRATLCF